jgi:sugar O-acyltransferase (sialic acid O-acetyltransferase NeuD family)
MKKKPLIVLGAGGHARSCIDIIEQGKEFYVAGLVVNESEIDEELFDYSVIASDAELEMLVDKYHHAVIGVGQISTAQHRIRLYELALGAGFGLPTIIAPSAHVSPRASIGQGSIVMSGAVINAGVVIGNNCIVNTNATIEHDTVIGSNCHISTGAIVNGSVVIGDNTFVGSGSVIKEGLTIGSSSIIGMGLSLRSNVAEETKFLGEVKF